MSDARNCVHGMTLRIRGFKVTGNTSKQSGCQVPINVLYQWDNWVCIFSVYTVGCTVLILSVRGMAAAEVHCYILIPLKFWDDVPPPWREH